MINKFNIIPSSCCKTVLIHLKISIISKIWITSSLSSSSVSLSKHFHTIPKFLGVIISSYVFAIGENPSSMSLINRLRFFLEIFQPELLPYQWQTNANILPFYLMVLLIQEVSNQTGLLYQQILWKASNN